MKPTFLLVLLFPLLALCQRDKVVIKGKIFDIVYSEKLEQPLVVNYSTTCSNGKASRSGMDFYTVDSVKTSDHWDYANNVYDKGHMCPAADFNCNPQTLKETFSYLNCALQHQDLNRGMWKQLEEYERQLVTMYGKIRVKITIDFTPPLKKLPTGATIPTGFFKEIYVEKTKQTLKYYMPNVAPKSNLLDFYKIK